jgi:hypothetical protein
MVFERFYIGQASDKERADDRQQLPEDQISPSGRGKVIHNLRWVENFFRERVKLP